MLDIFLLIPEITKGMKSLGSKALLNIKHSTVVLDYQIQQLRKINDACRIYVGAGFECDKIRKVASKYKNVHVIANPDYINTNQVKLIKTLIENEFDSNNSLLVVSNGVLLKNMSIKSYGSSKIFLIDKPKINFNIGCNESESFNYLFYDLPIPWSECVLFDPIAINNIKKLYSKHNIDQLFLFELINSLADNHKTVFEKNFILKKNIMKINTIKDIPKAKIFI
jgi:hypothetical protein